MHQASFILSGLYLSDMQELSTHPELKNLVHAKIHPKYSSATNKLQVRTMDGGSLDIALTFLTGSLSGVALNLLSSWIYDKYKENRVKKPMINGIEVDIENIAPEEILAIFTKNKTIDASEDSTKE
ncbi:hypothetical protein NQ814_08500 [Acinetobacter baumannii]|nr:hypothetical protein [Acinetobacter baumannii]MDC5478099.1 hypothetical protein [Acinetobacter baumannii]MDC5520215.1 hypothetical protein [Acinetobacter baumannii]